MDLLNLMIAIHKAEGVDIPEADYPKMITLDGRRLASLIFVPALSRCSERAMTVPAGRQQMHFSRGSRVPSGHAFNP
jgi:hypothetical protein